MCKKRGYIGIDIGGTKTNIGLLDEQGNIVSKRKLSTAATQEKGIEVVESIGAAIEDMLKELNYSYSITSIGIGVPGTVDRQNGTVLFAPNLGWNNMPLREMFSRYFNVPIFIGQDTEAAALGEYMFGEGSGLKDIVCITVGTGIGCGLIMDGKIYKGKFGTAGEFGHIIVEKEGLQCNCGKTGCLEAYASGTGMLKVFKKEHEAGRESAALFKQRIENIRTEDIFREAKLGDELCLSIISQAVDYLSIGIANLANIMGPEAVIISGGISEEKDLFIKPLIEKVNLRVYKLLSDKLIIKTAKLGPDAPMAGAAMLFSDPLYKNSLVKEVLI